MPSGGSSSLAAAVKRHTNLGSIFVKYSNSAFHCSTDTPPVTKQRQDFLIVTAAVIPTIVFPEPHGSTMTPERERECENILFSASDW